MLSLLCLLLLAACNGESGTSSEKKQDDNFTGLWYEEKSDSYLEIKEPGVVLLRTCSLNDGYTAEEGASYKLAGNKLSTLVEGGSFSSTLELKKEGTQLVLSYDLDSVLPPGYAWPSGAVVLTKQDTIPDSCDGDAIEITYYSPKEAIEGELTTFTVDYSYRLSSADKADFGVGFTITDKTMVSFGELISVSSKGSGSGSFSFDYAPSMVKDGVTYFVMVDMYVNLLSNPELVGHTAKKEVKVWPNGSSSTVEAHVGIEKQLRAHTLGLFK